MKTPQVAKELVRYHLNSVVNDPRVFSKLHCPLNTSDHLGFPSRKREKPCTCYRWFEMSVLLAYTSCNIAHNFWIIFF